MPMISHVWSTALKLGCITNFEMLFLVKTFVMQTPMTSQTNLQDVYSGPSFFAPHLWFLIRRIISARACPIRVKVGRLSSLQHKLSVRLQQQQQQHGYNTTDKTNYYPTLITT